MRLPSVEILFFSGLAAFITVMVALFVLMTWDRAVSMGGWDRYTRAVTREVTVCNETRTVCWNEWWTFVDGERVR